MLREIRELYAYNRWANQRILSAAAVLSPEELDRDLRSSFPSLLATLRHLLTSDWIWLERWNGRAPFELPQSWDVSSLESVSRYWADVEEDRAAFLEQLVPEDLPRTLEYRGPTGTFAAPLWVLLRHVANHSTYHRGQAVTLLRQLGAAAPYTDFVRYYREVVSAATTRHAEPA